MPEVAELRGRGKRPALRAQHGESRRPGWRNGATGRRRDGATARLSDRLRCAPWPRRLPLAEQLAREMPEPCPRCPCCARGGPGARGPSWPSSSSSGSSRWAEAIRPCCLSWPVAELRRAVAEVSPSQVPWGHGSTRLALLPRSPSFGMRAVLAAVGDAAPVRGLLGGEVRAGKGRRVGREALSRHGHRGAVRVEHRGGVPGGVREWRTRVMRGAAGRAPAAERGRPRPRCGQGSINTRRPPRR